MPGPRPKTKAQRKNGPRLHRSKSEKRPITPTDNAGKRFGVPKDCPSAIRSRVVPFARKLEAAGVDVEAYRSRWAAYIRHMMICHQAEQDLEKGVTVIDRFKAEKPNPAAQIHSTLSKIARSIEKDFLELLDKLGPQEKADPFEEFLGGNVLPMKGKERKK